MFVEIEGTIPVAIRIPHLGLAIYTSPKVLSTSLKYLAFELENNRPFEGFVVSGQQFRVHRLYPAKPFEPVSQSEYPHTVAFVRDPVKRFVSMFRNRIARKHAQSAGFWRKAVSLGLPEDPSFNEFIERFDDYESIPDVRHHAAPQVKYLGSNAGFYTNIFTDGSVAEFEALIQNIAGKSFRLPWEQRSGAVASPSLSGDNLAWIGKHYREDYEAFGGYFSRPEK